jgi:hypothetical protein
MDTNLAKQLSFLVNENTGPKLEKVIEQIIESNLYNVNDLLEHKNIQAVRFLLTCSSITR